MAKALENDGDNLNALAVRAERHSPKAVLVGDQSYSVKQQVNVPTLKHDTGVTVAIRIEQAIRRELTSREEEVTLANGEIVKGIKEGTLAVVRVTELGSGQLFNLVLNSITASELDRAYEDQSYVGKSFAIRKMGTVAGKRYKDVQIVEIEAAE